MTKGWLIGGAVFLAVLLIASVVVAVLEREELLAEGTPEATVQSFLRAVQDEEFRLAHSFLSDDLKEDCAFDQFFSRTVSPRGPMGDDRITLERTKTEGDIAFVTVRVTQFHGRGLFETSESSHEQRLILREEDGQWRFTEYPWPFSQCGPYNPERRPPEPVREPEPASSRK